RALAKATPRPRLTSPPRPWSLSLGSRTVAMRNEEETNEQPTHRGRTCRLDAVRNGAAPHANSDADRLQRRVLSRSAERAAARGRGAAPCHGRRAWRQAGPGPSPVLSERGRHG